MRENEEKRWLDSWLKGDQVCFKFVWSPSTSCLGLKSPKYQSAFTPDGDDDDYDHNGVGDDDGADDHIVLVMMMIRMVMMMTTMPNGVGDDDGKDDY